MHYMFNMFKICLIRSHSKCINLQRPDDTTCYKIYIININSTFCLF